MYYSLLRHITAYYGSIIIVLQNILLLITMFYIIFQSIPIYYSF